MNKKYDVLDFNKSQENSRKNPWEIVGDCVDVPMEDFLTVLDYEGFKGIEIEF